MVKAAGDITARVEPEIKEKAELILAAMGISASNGINMFYRQIILWNGLPFRLSVPANKPRALDEMMPEEFDRKIERGPDVNRKERTWPALLYKLGMWERKARSGSWIYTTWWYAPAA